MKLQLQSTLDLVDFKSPSCKIWLQIPSTYTGKILIQTLDMHVHSPFVTLSFPGMAIAIVKYVFHIWHLEVKGYWFYSSLAPVLKHGLFYYGYIAIWEPNG